MKTALRNARMGIRTGGPISRSGRSRSRGEGERVGVVVVWGGFGAGGRCSMPWPTCTRGASSTRI